MQAIKMDETLLKTVLISVAGVAIGIWNFLMGIAGWNNAVIDYVPQVLEPAVAERTLKQTIDLMNGVGGLALLVVMLVLGFYQIKKIRKELRNGTRSKDKNK